MAANDSRSYLGSLNKLVGEYNYAYNLSTCKKPVDTEYSALTEESRIELESNYKAPNFKVGNRVRIAKYKNIFSKGYTENWSTQILLLILC